MKNIIADIHIRGFKSLQDVEIELGQVNVFIGANGSGKTNLLEAIGFLGAAASGQIDDQALLRRGVRPSVPRLYQSSFAATESPDKIIFSVMQHWDGGSRRGDVKYCVELEPTPDVRPPSWSHTSSLSLNDEKIQPRLDDIVTLLSNYAIFSPSTQVLRGVTPDITQREPIGLSGGRLAEAIDDVMKSASSTGYELDELWDLLDWVDAVSVVPPDREIVSPSIPTTRNIIRFTDRWMSPQYNQLSAYDASEGALYVLFALALALHPYSPLFFAMDNFDQAMHPRLARAAIRLFCQKLLERKSLRGDCYQVLLTTHNPLVLDGLNLKDDRIRLFTVERNAQGMTRVYRVQVSDEILDATQDGLSLSNLWVMGRLGGVPDLF